MKKPKMIIFDYGQTLVNEKVFDALAGTRAVMESCLDNPDSVTAEEVSAYAYELEKEFGLHNPENYFRVLVEVHNHAFQRFLYEYFGMRPKVSPAALETVFWDNAAPGVPTEGISEFLDLLNQHNIRTGVISNISFGGETLSNRINAQLPNHRFEFIMASSDYVFRKPNRHIFEVALRKANLEPQHVWYCGDNVKCDIEGAAGCGITPVWYRGALRREANPPSVNFIQAESWKELSEHLAEL